MQEAMHIELWDKSLRHSGNVDFNIMYAGALPDEVAVDKAVRRYGFIEEGHGQVLAWRDEGSCE